MIRLLLLFTIIAGASMAHAQKTPTVSAADDPCELGAEAASRKALKDGATQDKADLVYQTSMIRCNGVTDPAYAAYAAAMRVEFARLAKLFLAHKITMNSYVSEVQDRRSKLALAEHSHTWAVAYVSSGDKDGDFVPDSMDRCTNSPPDSFTDKQGCPAKPKDQPAWIANSRREDPNPQTIDRIAASLGYMASPGCNDAPVPQPSEPIHQGFIRSAPTARYSIAVTRVLNQPAKCQVFYQVELQFINPPGSVYESKQIQVTLRDIENVDTTAQAPRRRVFQLTAASKDTEYQVYFASFHYGTVVWRVRSLNGNGMTSGWSPPKREDFDGVYDPLK
jgi:hypothetical protein